MIDSFLSLDKQITLYISRILPHNDVFDSIFLFLSVHGLTIIVWVILLALFVVLTSAKYKYVGVALTASFFTTSALINVILKPFFLRTRPYIVERISTQFCPENFSFPSGHAAGAFAIATIVAWADPKRKWIYYSIASLVALSRIYLYCHYVSDVVVGAVLGSMVSFLFVRLYNRYLV